MRICGNCFVSGIKHCNSLLALDGRELVQKFFERISTFKVIKERADRNTGSYENRNSA